MEFLNPMKIKEYNLQPISVVQEKFDGHYTEVYKSKTIPSGVYICSKKQKVNLWPKLKVHEVIKKQIESLPFETILRCELHAFNVPATSVPTMINDADPRLLLSPFKIEKWSGDPGPFYFTLETGLLLNIFSSVPSWWCICKTPTPVASSFLDIDILKAKAVKQGIEGWIVKDVPGGKAWKIKPQKTVDAFVVDYTISDSDSFAGGLKSIDIAVWTEFSYHQFGEMTIATVGTGFDAEFRMSVDPKTLIGRVGEFKYQSIGAKGRLIFPRFLRWRDDEKKSSDCRDDQLVRRSRC